MRRDPWEWAKLSALASLVAFGALLAMTFVLLLVHGLVWGDGIEDPTVFDRVLFLGVAIPFVAAPGVVVGGAAGARGWRLGMVALASALIPLGLHLVTVASPVAIWAGMVVGTLLGVVWLPASEVLAAPSVSSRSEGARGSGEGATGIVAEELTVLLDPPQRRLVPRDVLAPPEGWAVPEVLPPRPSRCEVEVEVDALDGRDGEEDVSVPAAAPHGGQASSS
jgi:hypothetical protein